jgi:DNA invertase Pin-like site-specific DNA recombinase
MTKYVAYFRVSTKRQGQSGLGLEAQMSEVNAFISNCGGDLIAQFKEVESGKRVRRPQLDDALRLCQREGATLVVAKLDRLARNVKFISTLMESSVTFKALDLPEANPLTIHILAAMAEREAQAISERTKAAAGAIKARLRKEGTIVSQSGRKYDRLGADDASIAIAAKAAGAASKDEANRYALDISAEFARAEKYSSSLADLARELNERNVPTYTQWQKGVSINQVRRDSGWYPSSARNVRNRLQELAQCA